MWSDPRPARVCIAVGDPLLRQQVCRALRGVPAVVVVVHGLDEVPGLATLDSERLVVLVGTHTDRGRLTGDELIAFRHRHPLAHVVLCIGREPLSRGRAAEFATASIDDLWLAGTGEEDLREQVLRRLEHVLPASLAGLLRYAHWSRGCAEESWCARNAYRRRWQ